ncbi:hypothetical protein Anas_05750 [Armadillidium nasatum]|uniref:Ig-like domain-containing protein n=1 Tax=Armadillidium nasatum TaxID=96803 RepID=A0A5N5SY73_9CRUS|nr:hypothetical protein Anas_05750 [Armadillidium nasatum]
MTCLWKLEVSSKFQRRKRLARSEAIMTMVLKGFKGFTLTVIVVVYCAKVSSSLRLLRVLIPPYAVRGQAAELICEFDSERSPLYSVKWFKDDAEFFRYVPAARQQYQFFNLDGLTVDNDSSSASRVVLKDLDFAASGSYRCEVLYRRS